MFTKSRFYSFDRSALVEEDVWNIPIDRNVRIEHNASFPAELVSRCIQTSSPRGGSVLDPFVGSGTVLDVASNLGRNAVGIDMSARYVAQVRKYLANNGAEAFSEKEFYAALSKPSPNWKTWRGNKANYRKPGTPRVSVR